MDNIIVTIISVVIICTTAAVSLVIILSYMNQRECQNQSSGKQWIVELWNIRYGYKVELAFSNSITVGRYNLQPASFAGKPVPEDSTVSREHVLIYEQNKVLWMWNLSTVNPANINGHRLNEPHMLQPGNRIELGNSVFLLTNIKYG